MKNYKKLFICALATLFVGAGIGGVSSLAANAAKTLTYTEKTKLDTPPASQLPLEDDKIKNITDWGYYNVDGEDVWYFSGDGTASGNPEIRFVTPGTDTSSKNPETGLYWFNPKTVDGFSFTYKIVNEDEKVVADKDVNYIVQAIASDGSYPIFTPEIIADGEWHTLNFDLNSVCTWANSTIDPANATFDESNELFSGFIFKMGGLKGEFMISDVYIRESKTQLEAAPATPITLEEGKVKNMTEWGYYNYGGKDSFYFYGNGTAAADPEVRFITEGTDTVNKPYTFAPVSVDSFSFDYKLTNTEPKTVKDMKETSPETKYIVQVLASDGSYPIFTPNFVADGEWHTLTFDLTTPCSWAKAAADDTEVNFDDVNELFSGMIVKAGGLKGELAIANVTVEKSKIPLESAPESPLALEEAKNKGMTAYGFYNVDGKDVWYFTSDGTKPGGKNPEIRFVTEGTETVNKPYTFAPVAMDSFSFSYKLTNTAEEGVVDLPANNYIIQVLASDGTYPIFTPAIVADGEWHTLTFDLATVLSDGRTFDDVNELFSGFIVKAGNLNGELMIADIAVVESPVVVPETIVNATLKTRNITWADGTAWMAYGTITAAEAGVIPTEASAQTYFAAKNAENIKLVRNGKTYVVGTPNAQSLQVDGYGQFYVKPSFLTFPADFEGEKKVQDGDKIILEGEFYGLTEGYNVGITARFAKTTMTSVFAPSASKPDGKYHCIVTVGEYNYYDMENVVARPGQGLNDGFYFLADKNDAYAESAWTQNYMGQPNTLAYIRDGKKYYTDREIIICKIREANGNELYYLHGYSVGKLGEILKDGDILVFDGIFQNNVGGNDAIVFDDVRFVLNLADRPETDSLDWTVTLVNPNVTFANPDGSVVANSGTLAVGSLVTAPETNPTMAEDANFKYEFAGWYYNGVPFDFTTAPVGEITLIAKYNAVAKMDYIAGTYGFTSSSSNHTATDVYFDMAENDLVALEGWGTRLKPLTKDAIILIRNGVTTYTNQAVTALCKTSATKYNISGWQFAGASGFQDGDIVIVNGYFEMHDFRGDKDNGATGDIFYMPETWFKFTVVDGKNCFEVLNPQVSYVDSEGGLVYKQAYAYGKPFTPAIPANEYFTYEITSCTYNGEDFDATQVYEGALTLVIEYTMTAKNAIETGYAVTDKWSNHDAGNGYFYMAANDAPYAADWSVRYEPVTPDAFVLIRDGVATAKGDVTNVNNKQVLCKIDENKYNIAGWYIGNAKHGDILVFNGYFKGWTKVDGEYQENGTILHIPATYIQYTEVDGKKAWTVLNPGVVFMDNAGKILSITSVAYGETLVLNEKDIPVVTKEADAQYTYEFLSWFNGDNSFDITTEITESIELRPAFSKTPVNYMINVTLPNGNVETVNFNVETADVKALVEAVKPADNAEYTYAWGGKGLPDTFDLTHYDLEIVAIPVEYKVNVTLADGTVQTVTYTIETVKEAYATVAGLLPADNAEYTYAWGGKGLPEYFDLTHYDLEIVATAVEYIVTVTLADNTVETVTFTVETIKEAYAQVADMLPADNAEYTYAWGGKGLPEYFDLTHYDLEIVATAVEYTVTVTLADNTVETVTFTIETIKEAYAQVAGMLPADNAEYTYAWADALPEEFALQNYNFTVVATAVEPEQPGTSEEPEQPGTSEEPEVPGTSEEPEVPGTSEEPEVPGTSEEPEVPSASEEPTTSEPTTSEPADEELPLGCFGGVNAITFGVIALGLGVMKLFKKKED